jgi:hypothetical protein
MTGTRYGLYDLDWLLRSLRARARPRRAAPRGRRLQGPPRGGGILPRAAVHVPAGVLPQGDARGGVRAALGVPPLRRPRRRRPRARRAPPRPCAFARAEPVSVGAYLSLDDNTLWCAVDAWRATATRCSRALRPRACGRACSSRPPRSTTSTPRTTRAPRRSCEAIVRAAASTRAYHAALDVAEVLPYEAPASPRRGAAGDLRAPPAAAAGARVVHHRAHRRHLLRPPSARISCGGARGRHGNARGPAARPLIAFRVGGDAVDCRRVEMSHPARPGQRYSEEIDVDDLCGLRVPALGVQPLEFHYGFTPPRRGRASHARSIVTDERAETFADITTIAPPSLVAVSAPDAATEGTSRALLTLTARGSSASSAAGLRVSVTLRNPSVQAVWTLLRPTQFSFVVTDPEGREVACNALLRQPAPLRDLFARLPARGRRSYTLLAYGEDPGRRRPEKHADHPVDHAARGRARGRRGCGRGRGRGEAATRQRLRPGASPT